MTGARGCGARIGDSFLRGTRAAGGEGAIAGGEGADCAMWSFIFCRGCCIVTGGGCCG